MENYGMAEEAAKAVTPNAELLEWPKKDKRRLLHAVYRVGDLDRTIKWVNLLLLFDFLFVLQLIFSWYANLCGINVYNINLDFLCYVSLLSAIVLVDLSTWWCDMERRSMHLM